MPGKTCFVYAKPAKNLVAGIGVTNANNQNVMYVVMVINSSTAHYMTNKQSSGSPLTSERGNRPNQKRRYTSEYIHIHRVNPKRC